MRTKAPRSSCQLPENDPNPRGGQDCTSGYAAEQPDTEEREDGTIRYRRNCGEGGLYAWREMAQCEATIKTTCDWVLEFGEGDANYKWASFFLCRNARGFRTSREAVETDTVQGRLERLDGW